jgi:hypothetical protein
MTRQQTRARLEARFPGIRGYGLTILEAVHRKYPEVQAHDLEQIEEVMRCEYSTLDHLDYQKFARLASNSWLVVKELRADGTYPTPGRALTQEVRS